MSDIAFTMERDGAAAELEVVIVGFVFRAAVEELVVTHVAHGQVAVVLAKVVDSLAAGIGFTLELVVGIGGLHRQDVVIHEHDVAQLLGILLHVFLGIVDIGLCGGDEVVGIVAHMHLVGGHEHTVALKEL